MDDKEIHRLIEEAPPVEELLGDESPDVIPDRDRPEDYRETKWKETALYFKRSQ